MAPLDGCSNVMQTHSFGFGLKVAEVPSLSIAIVGATSDLSRRKIFPALFALYYSGFLPEVGPLLRTFLLTLLQFLLSCVISVNRT